jgi:hypothetical protein
MSGESIFGWRPEFGGGRPSAEAHMSLKPLVLIAALAAALLTEPSSAQDDAFVQVSALFEAGWKPSSKGRETSQAIFQDLRRSDQVDPRVSFAYALVQMRNLKYDEARRLLDEVLAARPSDASARRAKIWVLVITQNYSAALVEMERLASKLSGGRGARESQNTVQLAGAAEESEALSVEFLGRVMGYIDGPAARAVAEHVRADFRKRLVAPLSTADRRLFEEAYGVVQKRFAELNLDRDQTKADAKADQEKRQERIQQELERDRALVAREKSGLQARNEKLAADIKQELGELDAKARPIVSRQSRLEAQAAAITREMAGLQVEIERLLVLADTSEDSVEAFELRAAARRLSVALGRYDVDLRAINGELAGLAAQRVQLAAQRQASVARNRAATDEVERRLIDLRTTDRRISSEEKKANQPVGGNTAAVVALAAKARAFTTYEPFPFEEERARLLQSLGKQDR